MIKPISIVIEETEQSHINIHISVHHKDGSSNTSTVLKEYDMNNNVKVIVEEIYGILQNYKSEGVLE